MSAQITVRVPDELRRKLENTAKRNGLRKSVIARQALEEYLSAAERLSDVRPYDKVRSLIGSVSSNKPDLGEKHREYLMARLTGRNA